MVMTDQVPSGFEAPLVIVCKGIVREPAKKETNLAAMVSNLPVAATGMIQSSWFL